MRLAAGPRGPDRRKSSSGAGAGSCYKTGTESGSPMRARRGREPRIVSGEKSVKIRWKKVIPIALGLFILSFACVLFYIRHRLDASLPRLEGRLEIAGLAGEVKVTRDARGIVRIEAGSLDDLVLAQGFVHAQERFFQMDLARRFAGGELAELVGERALELDVEKRKLGNHQVAERMLARLEPGERELFARYTAGVNAGLAALDDVPPEYLVLRKEPRGWSAADCLRVGFYFFDVLSFNERYEREVGVMDACLPVELVDYLTPDVAANDVTIVGSAAAAAAPLPAAEVFDLRRQEIVKPARDLVRTFDDLGLGSNSWAVGAARSKSGRAILANDPHLNIGLPNVWFRMELDWGAGRALGATTPGVPGVVIGSNGRVAWGLTNGMVDHEDLVIVEVDEDDPGLYRVPEGLESFGERRETIAVAGRDPVEIVVRRTRWGPVVGEDVLGRPLALKSTGLDPETHDFSFLNMMFQTSLEEALAVAAGWRGPAQNVLVADDRGRIGWVLSGFIPARRGFDGKRPVSWADGSRTWTGALDESRRPRLLDPPSGLLFSANNRLVPIAEARALSRLWVPAWRARRIAELLDEKPGFDEEDLLAIQLDTRVAQFDRYRDLALALHPEEPEAKALRVALAEIRAWNGRADLDSRGLHLLKLFGERLREALIAPLVAVCGERDEKFVYNWPAADEVVFRLMAEKPSHLLDPAASSFEALARATFAKLVLEIDGDPGLGVDMPWGALHRPAFEHPLGKVPPLNHFLNLPRVPLPGDANALRAQSNRFGASMRMVVAPGAEEKAILESPGGQSGHFRSAHYGDLHEAWVEGRPDPMKPGAVVSTLVLAPASN